MVGLVIDLLFVCGEFVSLWLVGCVGWGLFCCGFGFGLDCLLCCGFCCICVRGFGFLFLGFLILVGFAFVKIGLLDGLVVFWFGVG